MLKVGGMTLDEFAMLKGRGWNSQAAGENSWGTPVDQVSVQQCRRVEGICGSQGNAYCG
jgi:hypothetical protein